MTTTGDGNYLALNSTILTLGVIVLLGVALVAMLAVGGGGLFSQKSSSAFLDALPSVSPRPCANCEAAPKLPGEQSGDLSAFCCQ